MDQVARQFMRAVRGGRSQIAFARRLGYRSNPVAEWEAGRRAPTAAEALRACRLSHIDVHQAFTAFHPTTAPILGSFDDDGVAHWLNALRGGTPIQQIAARADRSRYAVARWLSGRARPRLPDFFVLVEAITGRLPDLIAALVPIGEVPAVEPLFERLATSRRLALDEPWAPAVMCLLETAAYQALPRHSTDYVAGALQIPPEVAQGCLDRLATAGVITEVDGRFAMIGELTVDTRATPGIMEVMKRHWIEVGLARLPQPRPGDYFGFNVFSVSRADLEEIRRIYESAFRQVRARITASEPREVVALLNVQLMDWDTPPADSPEED